MFRANGVCDSNSEIPALRRFRRASQLARKLDRRLKHASDDLCSRERRTLWPSESRTLLGRRWQRSLGDTQPVDDELINHGGDWESGTTLDSASATYTNRNLSVTQIRQQAILAGVLSSRHAFDGHYSKCLKSISFASRSAVVQNRVWSRYSRRTVPIRRLRTDAKAARKEPS